MPTSTRELGKLVSIHEVSPAAVHRAVIVAAASFVFFLATLFAFYAWQQIGYFVLSSAFLVLYLFMMTGIWIQKRSIVKIYQNGISFKKFNATWDEIKTVKADAGSGIFISKDKGQTVTLPRSISGIGDLAVAIRNNLPK